MYPIISSWRVTSKLRNKKWKINYPCLFIIHVETSNFNLLFNFQNWKKEKIQLKFSSSTSVWWIWLCVYGIKINNRACPELHRHWKAQWVSLVCGIIFTNQTNTLEQCFFWKSRDYETLHICIQRTALSCKHHKTGHDEGSPPINAQAFFIRLSPSMKSLTLLDNW